MCSAKASGSPPIVNAKQGLSMLQERYSYSGIVDRPTLRWPGDARVALWVVPNVEHYEFVPPHSSLRNPWPRSPHPDILGYSQRDFGNRVGIWRLFDLVDELQLKCSVSLNLGVYEHFPAIMDGCEKRKWDVICHGIYNTGHVLGLSEDEERNFIQSCIDKCRQLTGRSFNGWFSPGLSYSDNTVDLLAAAGIRYFCDWPLDDQPVQVNVKSGRLTSMPYQLDINDGIYFNRRYRHGDGEGFACMIKDYFDRLYAEGDQ